MTTSVAVVGATGTLGRIVSAVIDELDDFEQIVGLNSQSDLTEMLGADLVVDVTTPSHSAEIVHFAVANGKNVLVGTSGWSAERIDRLRTQRADVAATGTEPGGVVIVPNFSVGSVVATGLATVAARFFDAVEIVETHGPRKIDSPSGTAIRTAELIAEARAGLPQVSAPNAQQRARGEQVAGVPVHSRRMLGVVAAQEVLFGGTGQTVSIRHDTSSPDSYRDGIVAGLRAARAERDITVGLDALIGLPEALLRAAALAGGREPEQPGHQA